MSGDPNAQEPNNAVTCQHKCRIPQRLPPGHQRPALKAKAPITECASRPKSANRAINDINEATPLGTVSRSARPERDRPTQIQKKQAPIHRRNINEKDVSSNKAGRQIITVPVKQKYTSKATYHNKLSPNLPDQETIKKFEELELEQEDFSEAVHMYNSMNDMFLDFNEEETITSRSDQIMQLKTCWQEKIVQFEEMKNELNDRQDKSFQNQVKCWSMFYVGIIDLHKICNKDNGILEVYASLRNTKQKLMSMGQKAGLPSTDDLRIMNVANMTPNQLLQLCAETKCRKNDNQSVRNTLTIDMKRLNEMPLKLVAICEQTLETRKQLIDWFEGIKNQEKGCPKSSLSKKINEFNAEYEMLSNSLQTIKNEFLKELNDFLRTCWNERVGLQLRNEELTCEVSELNSQNIDLKKQLCNAEKQKSQVNRRRFEELEKELKEEKVKRMTMRERLSRAEGQVKIEGDRASQLEAALNQARAQTRNLERTVQNQYEQNQQLQKDFDEELHKLKESMKKNTAHLEEIATARETLQQEKNDLKQKLEELSNHYNESLTNMKQELSTSIAKLIDAEKKCSEEIEEKKNLQKTVESQCAHLLEYELRLKDTVKQLEETEKKSNELMNCKKDLEKIKHEFGETLATLEKYKHLISEKNETIIKMENKLKTSQELENKLQSDLNNKENYVAILEKNQLLLQQQIQDNEYKMKMYEDQLTTLKGQITKLQEHFVEFENLNEIHTLVTQENSTFTEMRRKNNELTIDLQKKQIDLENLIQNITEKEDLIRQKQNVLQMLSEREEEQTNVLQLNQVICEKNCEIQSLITNIEKRKEQISQLEKIIITIEEQNRKYAIQKRKDQDKIRTLEKTIAESEFCLGNKNKELVPRENLDNLLKILEEELGTPLDSQFIKSNRKTENIGIHNDINYHIDYYDGKESNHKLETKAMPAKIVTGNFIKKTYIPSNDEHGDNHLLRKQAITNIDTQKWIQAPDGENAFALQSSLIDNNKFRYLSSKKATLHTKENFLKTLQYNVPNQIRSDKKCKMFKLASHRLV